MALADNRVRGGSGGWEEEEGWDVGVGIAVAWRELQISSCRIRSESGKLRRCACDNCQCYRIQSSVVDLLTKKCFNTTSVERNVNSRRRWIQMSS